VAGSGRTEVREMLVAAIGCNLAWGLADAVMYLVRTATERVRSRQLLARLHADAATGERLLAQALPQRLQALATPALLAELYRQVLAQPRLHPQRLLTRSDWAGALGVFLLVVLATFPVVLPFLFFDTIALAMLFGAGVTLGRYAGGRPGLLGLAMAATGAVLVASIILLGG
jgi:hypothetical protein